MALIGLNGRPYISVLVYADAAQGKAQPLDSLVLTSNGWIELGALKPGDKLFGRDGKLVDVLRFLPQGKRKTYRIEFSDGIAAESCDEHHWLTRTASEVSHGAPGKVRQLSEIRRQVKLADGRSKHLIPWAHPVQFSTKELPIHPYLLGVLLGDGNLGNTPKIYNPERDVVDRALSFLPPSDDFTQFNQDDGCPAVRIRKISHGPELSSTASMLGQLGLLGLLSYDKFIPNIYLYGSIEQRSELLAGLIDTDGTVNLAGRERASDIEYSTSSKCLAEGVVKLVLSLGGRATVQMRTGAHTKNDIHIETRVNYRVRISNLYIAPVRSVKHLSKWQPPRREPWRAITSVEPMRETETACIEVSGEGLYLTNDFVVTHNSTFAATAPKKMLVLCFDQKNKETPYIKRGKIIEEGIDERFNVPFIKIGTKQTGKHIITVEYYRNDDPERPTALPRFLKRMSKLHEEYDNYETFVLDSTTYLELAARWNDQFVVNPGSREPRQHYAASGEQIERQVMGRFAALPKNSIVICHVNKEKEQIGGRAVQVPAAPGAKARKLPSAYSEVYRPYIDPKNSVHYLQTMPDGLWLAQTQINAPNPSEPTWEAIWANYNQE